MSRLDTLDPLDALAAINRLVAAIIRLTHALAAPPATLAAGLARNVQDRLDRLAARLLHVGISFHAAPKPRQPSDPPTSPAPTSPADPRPPRQPGWLLDVLPETAPAIADEVRAVLQDPAMAALLADDPVTRRMLQPLCRMLGLDLASLLPTPPDELPPDWLPLPHLRAHAPLPQSRPASNPTPDSPHPPPLPHKITAW